MRLTRFEPFRVAEFLQQEPGAFRSAGWQPATDIIEYSDAYLVRLDLPGVDAEAIDINTDKGILTIAGERAAFEASDDAKLTRRERVSGRFERRFSLPDTADIDNIRAQCRSGILEVRIPKVPEVQARKISVEAA